jgi:membrane protein
MKYKFKRYFFSMSPPRVRHSTGRAGSDSDGGIMFRYTSSSSFSFRNLQEDEILNRANSVAYSFMLAIFPAIIFLFTLIPYITTWIPSVNTDNIMLFLSDMMPASMYDVINTTVRDIISNQRGGLLTLGFVFSLWLATNGMMSLMNAFNACYKTSDRRKGWKMRLVATGLTINLAIVLCLAVVLLVVGQLALDYVVLNLGQFEWLEGIDKWTVNLLLMLRFHHYFHCLFPGGIDRVLFRSGYSL